MYLSKVRMVVLVAAVVLAASLGLSRLLVGPQQAVAVEKGRDVPGRAVQRAPEDEARADVHALLPPRPVGQWERKLGPWDFSFRITPERIIGQFDIPGDKQRLRLIVEGDYAVSKEHVLYGVITGADLEGAGQSAGFEEMAQLQVVSSQIIDQPFSLRYRVDDDILTIKNLKCSPLLQESGDKGLAEMLVMVVGRYKRTGQGVQEKPR
jgi:hypothetical protein